jgi:glyoxylase-like metal-dependent hydrolase (beta-lactamase superfamily II)
MKNDPALTPRVAKIAEGLFVRLAVDNIAWIDLGDGLLVVDALEQPELEEEVLAAIASTAGERPVRYVLNTHGHHDHVALNEAFRRRWGAQIVCQPAARLPKEGRWFQGPRRKVLMQPMGGCHTAEDCVVWSPQDRALFVGDIFGWGLIPSTRLDDRTARLLVETYEKLIAFDPQAVIPGHGPLCGKAELARWVEYFRWLKDQAARACAAGRSGAEVRRAVAPPADMKTWWRFLDWKHEDSVSRVLSAVRSGRLKADE